MRTMPGKTARPGYIVGGHETFAFRTGWLKKGYDALNNCKSAFTRDDAVVRLGVGKNMVRSIRFWCLATQIASAVPPLGKGKELQPTELGHQLLGDMGWDPYLEDPGSLWLIHWLLVTNPRASAWWYIFGQFPDVEFTKPRLLAFLQSIAEDQQVTVSTASLERDVDCFVRTYVPSVQSGTSLLEASFDCPLADLGLIRPADADGVYGFRIGRKETLPPHVVGFALLQFFRAQVWPRRSVHIRDCLYLPGSPGQTFKLDEESLLDAVYSLKKLTKGRLDVTETAGVVQVFLHFKDLEGLTEMSLKLLDRYYGRDKRDGA